MPNQEQDIWKNAPFVKHLEGKPLYVGDGVAEFLFQHRPEFSNRGNQLHGGAIAAMMDVVASIAMRSREAECGIVTMNLNVSYIAPATGEATFVGRVIKSGRSTGWVEVRATGVDGELLATAAATMRLVRKRQDER